jgi:hypothetical protein
MGGRSTLEHIPDVARATAVADPAAARGRVIVVSGHVSSVRDDGGTCSGMLTLGSETNYFITPFSTEGVTGPTRARFRGVFVQKVAPAGQSSSLVLVGAFGP